jgi:hypothetical protein
MLAANLLLEGPPVPESEVPDKQKNLGPPVWGFVVGLTSSFRRNTAVSKPRQREATTRTSTEGLERRRKVDAGKLVVFGADVALSKAVCGEGALC